LKQETPTKFLNDYLRRLILFAKARLQCFVITLQFFGENSLANHASACAYGFLLSVAPALMLVSFFLFTALDLFTWGGEGYNPQVLAAQISNIPFLEGVLSETWLVNQLPSFAESGMQLRGMAGLVSIVCIFWAGRVFALSLQRGLKTIFTGTKKRNPLTDNMAVLLVELAVLVSVMLMLLFSQSARHIYEIFSYFPIVPIFLSILTRYNIHFVFLFILALLFYLICRYFVANGPSRRSAFWGSFCFVFSYAVLSRILTMLLDQTRYNFLYGTLGKLVTLLVQVFFFFMFFFVCAQLASVLDSFDALLFIKLHQARSKKKKRLGPLDKLFFSAEGRLQKYFRSYPGGMTIFSREDAGKEVFYLLEGEVEVFMLSENSGGKPFVLNEGDFFGEMGYFLSENRSATTKARYDVSVLVLPPVLFDEMLKHDTAMGRTIIEHLSGRLKTMNEQYSAMINEDGPNSVKLALKK
jgi:membrane protein